MTGDDTARLRAITGGLGPADALSWLRLQRCLAWQPERVRPLLADGASPEEVLSRLVERGRAGRGDAPAESDLRNASERAERDQVQLEGMGGRVLPATHEDYPVPLAQLEDAPPVLLVRGRVESLAPDCVAIVGARAATASARTQARRLGRELAASGLTIVSGLARGVDAEAHRGALEVGGVTVAVLAGGVDRIYPPEHRDLAREICQSGAVLSEMPLGTPPRRELFPLRNRIISGLCRGVVVVEARSRSGSLITVRHALAQGREVFVLPGASEGPFAEGSNRLLRDGARAIRGAADVLEDLGMDSSQGAPGRGGGPSRGGLEDLILSLLGDAPRDRERLLVEVKADPGRLAAALLGLELAGHVVEERDGRLYRAW